MKRLVFLAFLVAVTAGGLLDDLPRQRRDLDTRTVSIRDLTKRSAEPYPNELHLQVRTADGETETFVVKRNLHFNAEVPVESSENGVKKRHVFAAESSKAEYLSKRAALHVRSEKENNHYKRSFTGFLHKRSGTYLVERDASGDHVSTKIETPPIIESRIQVGEELHDGLRPPSNRTGFTIGKRYPPGKTLYPDILMVLDFAVWTKMGEKYQDLQADEREQRTVERIKEYYSLVGAGLAHRYEQVNYQGMTIKPRIAGFLILKTAQDDVWVMGDNKDNDNNVSGYEALAHQSHWFQRQLRAGEYKNIDHCMMITGSRMYTVKEAGKRSYGTVGLAYVGEVCQYWRTSMNEEDYSMRVVGTAAHELGHNLGANHDGEGCIDSFIMTPWVTDGNDDTFGNQFKFSRCSMEQFYKDMEESNGRRANCMTDRPELEHEIQQAQNIRPGSMFTMNQQCQMFTGNDNAYYCGPGGECRKLHCDTGNGRCSTHDSRFALYGTRCGGRSECRYGVCHEF